VKNKKLNEFTANIRIKLAGLWITLMLFYIYCDIYSMFRTGHLEEAMSGKMGPFEVSQVTLAIFGVLMIIPALMVPACLFLKARITKWINIIIGGLYILVNIGNLIGETWVYYWIYGIFELMLTIFIIIVATKWSKKDNCNADEEAN